MNTALQGFQPSPMTAAQMQQGASPNLSSMDLSSVFGDMVSKNAGLLVQFFYHRVKLAGRSNPLAGRSETRLAVAMQPRGDRLTISIRDITEDQAQRDFPAEWQHFKKHLDTPTNGTPLHELPGATQSMIAILALHGLRSIEDVGLLPADICSQIGMDAVHAQKLSKIWLQRKSGAAEEINLTEQLSQRDVALENALAEIRVLKQANAVAEGTIQALQRIVPTAAAAPGYGAGPLGAPIGQPQVHPVGHENQGVLMVDPEEYRVQPDHDQVDIFTAPRNVVDTSDLSDPLNP